MTHLHTAFVPNQRHDRVVRLRASCSRIDHNPNHLVLFKRQTLAVKRQHDVSLAEHLLQRVEGKARQLGLYEVGAVLHLYFSNGVRLQWECIVRRGITKQELK